jgi:Fur family ferric uptake transcriptional regulator
MIGATNGWSLIFDSFQKTWETERMSPSSTPARGRLVDAGLRVTAPRLAVLEALDSTQGHVTADEVRRAVVARIGTLSVQAAYDVLGALSLAGLIRCIETPGHPARYEARVGDNHHHFVCRLCGTTIDVDCATGVAPCLAPHALPRGFDVDEAEVTYWGTCPDCKH